MPVAPTHLLLRSADGELEASFEPRAGMLACSLRHRGEQLLGADGIPILHPWANRLASWGYAAGGREVVLDAASALLQADEHGLPIHGVLRDCQRWEAELDDAAGLSAVLDYGAHEDLLAVFPYPHRVELSIRLSGRALVVTTAVTATAEAPVPLTFGFHPYFRVPGVARADWTVELPERLELDLDDRQLPTGSARLHPAERGPLGARTFDHLFRPPAPTARFAVSGGGRRIVVETGSGYPYAQVFAPAAQDVICFEPMTAPVAALSTGRELRWVAPGETQSATFAVRVERAA